MIKPWRIKCAGCPKIEDCQRVAHCAILDEPLVTVDDETIDWLRAISRRLAN